MDSTPVPPRPPDDASPKPVPKPAPIEKPDVPVVEAEFENVLFSVSTVTTPLSASEPAVLIATPENAPLSFELSLNAEPPMPPAPLLTEIVRWFPFRR